MFPRVLAMCVVAVGLFACSGEATTPDTTVPSGLAPEAVVEELLDAIAEGRFEDTAPLTDSTQAVLFTLAEGADAADVLEAMDAGGDAVAANFWSGFAQAIDADLAAGSVELETGEVVPESGEEFVTVTLTVDGGDRQYFVLRQAGGWKIDLMATFAPVLAERLIPPVESLLGSANADAGVVLGYLSEQEPSLNHSFTRPDLPADVHQHLLALVERVTR